MALNTTMRAVVYSGTPYNMSVMNVPKPTIINETDVVLRITTSAICGSDLHMYHGISEVGDGVSSLSVGDYVVCNMDSYGEGGKLGGFQAEFTRVSFADASLIPVPLTAETINSSIEMDYLTLTDIFPTAWSDLHAPRDRAASIGAIPVNFAKSDPVSHILSLEPEGVTRAIDCVGIEAVNRNGTIQENLILEQMINVVSKQGGIGQVGLYVTQGSSPGAPLGDTLSLNISFPITRFFEKNLRYQAGFVDPKTLAPQLVKVIAAGQASPSFIKTAVIAIEDVSRYYQRFDDHEEIKVYIQFP
ncbi:chaperonin 10-like protein [Aspergillus venezuelensis]